MKLIPASSAAWMMRTDSSCSGLPHAPNIIAPRQNLLTDTPVRPSGRCSIAVTCPESHCRYSPARSSARKQRRPRQLTAARCKSATRSWFEDDGAAAAFDRLRERFGGACERIAGSDVDVELALRERRGEQAELIAVGADDY